MTCCTPMDASARAKVRPSVHYYSRKGANIDTTIVMLGTVAQWFTAVGSSRDHFIIFCGPQPHESTLSTRWSPGPGSCPVQITPYITVCSRNPCTVRTGSSYVRARALPLAFSSLSYTLESRCLNYCS